MIEVFDPTSGPAKGQITLAPRLDTLDGKSLGIIWNGRSHGDKVLNAVIDLLKQKYRFETVVLRKKPFIGNVAPLEIQEEIAAVSDAVITGIGD
jgi:hypothetical protein